MTTTAQARNDDASTTGMVASVLSGAVPFTWEEAGRYLNQMVDVASSLADRLNTLARRYPVTTSGVLLGATIAGVATWRRGRTATAKPAARASSSPRAAARAASSSPSRTTKRRPTTTPRARRGRAATSAAAAT